MLFVLAVKLSLPMPMLLFDLDPHILPRQGCPAGPAARMAEGPEGQTLRAHEVP